MSETEVTTEVQVDLIDDLDAFSSDFFGQKQAEPAPASVEAEQDEDNETEVDDTEAQDTKVDPAEETEEAPKEAPKKKSVQDRIDELVRQREDVKREADARIDALRKEFEDKLVALQPKPVEQKKSAEPTPNDLKEDGTVKYELGEFDPQYIRDLTRYTLEQERTQAVQREAQERQVREQEQARDAITSNWNQRVEAAKAEYPDLVEKGQALLSGFNDLNADYAGYLSTVLMSMDKGPDVLYYLSNHPEEARTIVNSGAQKATLALGRIEAKFLEADAKKQSAKPKISSAPPPPPVRARGTNGAFVSVASDTDDLKAFEAEFFRS